METTPKPETITPKPETITLTISSIYLVMRGDPNEGYSVEAVATTPEEAGGLVRELADGATPVPFRRPSKEIDRMALRALKWGELKVEEYRAEEGGGLELVGELEPKELGL